MRRIAVLLLCLASFWGYSQKLVRAEYFIDTDPGPSKGVPIIGITKADSLDVKNLPVPTTGLAEGSHILGLRAQDSLGMWSPTYIMSFSILSGNGNLSTFNQSRLVRAEYFIDTDPGPS
ncbi:MAG TPA: hypothetical protein DCR46_05150, partial [Cytophagales bacterium]|nr:hypothetical protein [Cytophagales bacterium]